MVSSKNTTNENGDHYAHETLVYGHRLSSVGPGNHTGDLSYEPSNIDLAMKAHYLRVVYFLESQAVEGLTIGKIKEYVFSLLNHYYETCGRFRRYENGRPYIKCNDCGMRFVEAKSPKTLEEWLQFEDTFSQRLLVYDHVLGPELMFSPPTFLQVTSLKCGGMAVGLSWAHVLGDAFSLSNFMNHMAQSLNGHNFTSQPNLNKSPPKIMKPINPSTSSPSLCLKQVDPLGDNWAIPASCEMDTYSFHVTSTQLAELQLGLAQPFEALCAVIWRAVAKIENGPSNDTVTVIKHDITGPKADDMILRNSQVISSVKAHYNVAEAHLKELVGLIRDQAQDERAQIEEIVGEDSGGSDFIIYGSNLTFVDLGEAKFYGFEVKGFRPKLVNCFVDSIGGEGVVLVLPSPKKDKQNGIIENDEKIGGEGRFVTMILPKNYMEEVKEELKKELAFIV